MGGSGFPTSCGGSCAGRLPIPKSGNEIGKGLESHKFQISNLRFPDDPSPENSRPESSPFTYSPASGGFSFRFAEDCRLVGEYVRATYGARTRNMSLIG